MHNPDPLFDFTISLMASECPHLDASILSHLRSCICRFLNGALPYGEFRAIAVERCGSGNFVDRIHEILTVPEEPLPDPRQAVMAFSLAGTRNKTRSWTTQEDNRLLAAVRKFGLSAGTTWCAIADFVGNGRTRSQCSQRWIRVLDPRICKTHWSKEEDKALVDLVATFGEKSWMKIATVLGNRSDVQCRYRWMQMQRGTKECTPKPAKEVVQREPVDTKPMENLQIPLASSMELRKSDPLFDSTIWIMRGDW
jgi:hypothetical protein